MTKFNRGQRRALKKKNNAELVQIVERQVREIYFLKQENAKLKRGRLIDVVDSLTGEVTRVEIDDNG